eukprot:m51a1_g14176 hypothetical protein (552) ;mRNA; f:46086-48220
MISDEEIASNLLGDLPAPAPQQQQQQQQQDAPTPTPSLPSAQSPASTSAAADLCAAIAAGDAAVARMRRIFGLASENAPPDSPQSLARTDALLDTEALCARARAHAREVESCADILEQIYSQASVLEGRLDKTKTLCRVAVSRLEDLVARRSTTPPIAVGGAGDTSAAPASTSPSSLAPRSSLTAESALALMHEIEVSEGLSGAPEALGPQTPSSSSSSLSGAHGHARQALEASTGTELLRLCAQMLGLTLTLENMDMCDSGSILVNMAGPPDSQRQKTPAGSPSSAPKTTDVPGGPPQLKAATETARKAMATVTNSVTTMTNSVTTFFETTNARTKTLCRVAVSRLEDLVARRSTTPPIAVGGAGDTSAAPASTSPSSLAPRSSLTAESALALMHEIEVSEGLSGAPEALGPQTPSSSSSSLSGAHGHARQALEASTGTELLRLCAQMLGLTLTLENMDMCDSGSILVNMAGPPDSQRQKTPAGSPSSAPKTTDVPGGPPQLKAATETARKAMATVTNSVTTMTNSVTTFFETTNARVQQQAQNKECCIC